MKSILSIGKNPRIQALCIGKFDGVHLGHQAIFSTLYGEVEDKQEAGILIVCKSKDKPSLTPFQDSLCPLCCIHVELSEISSMGGEEFMDALKNSYPNLKKIIVGEDFRFGKGRSCGIEELKREFEVIVVPEVKLGNEGIHTQNILSYLSSGDLARVNAMLGRMYCIKGQVHRGQGLGKKELFPTINLSAPLYILPPDGVYLTSTNLKGKKYNSVSFLGHRLSTDGQFCIECYLLDFDDEVKDGEEIEVEFYQKLRENQKFNSLADLKSQIAQDILQAKAYHLARKRETIRPQAGF